MSFRNEAHIKFDKYIANPYAACLSGLGFVALSIKGAYEVSSVLVGEQQMTLGEVMEPLAYGAGALALGAVTVAAFHHGTGPNHIPPQ